MFPPDKRLPAEIAQHQRAFMSEGLEHTELRRGEAEGAKLIGGSVREHGTRSCKFDPHGQGDIGPVAVSFDGFHLFEFEIFEAEQKNPRNRE
jgi:hypothetical protein